MEKDYCCETELIWVKPTGSQQREEVRWFEGAGVHVINDILHYPVTAGAERYFSCLIWEALCMSCIPSGAVGRRGWAATKKTLLAKVQGDTLVSL